MNFQLRKIIKNRGHFPNDDAVVKLLWLAIRDIEDKRTRERTKRPDERNQRTDGHRRMIEGARSNGWKSALAALTLAYPERLANKIN